MTTPSTQARVEGTLDPLLAEKLSLAFDMRSKEVAAGLHGWDAATQSLRVAILADIAGAIRQYAQSNASPNPLLVALREIAEYRPTPQAQCGGCVHHVIDIAHRVIANGKAEG